MQGFFGLENFVFQFELDIEKRFYFWRLNTLCVHTPAGLKLLAGIYSYR
jgi:hypothetical protein